MSVALEGFVITLEDALQMAVIQEHFFRRQPASLSAAEAALIVLMDAYLTLADKAGARDETSFATQLRATFQLIRQKVPGPSNPEVTTEDAIGFEYRVDDKDDK